MCSGEVNMDGKQLWINQIKSTNGIKKKTTNKVHGQDIGKHQSHCDLGVLDTDLECSVEQSVFGMEGSAPSFTSGWIYLLVYLLVGP